MNILRIQNLNVPAIIWQKPASFTNKNALKLLGTELEKSMSKKKANQFVVLMRNICKKFNIEARNLPINSEHPGNLTPEQNFSVYEEVLNSTVFNRKA